VLRNFPTNVDGLSCLVTVDEIMVVVHAGLPYAIQRNRSQGGIEPASYDPGGRL